MGTFILLGIAILIAIWLVSLYNRLVKLRNNRENSFADIDVQLRQRHDLIPQLVEAVKGYMKHESTVLTDVTNARANAMKRAPSTTRSQQRTSSPQRWED